jgi:hypothetical protein
VRNGTGCGLRCSNGKSSIQHARAKHKSIALPAGLVLPVFPYEFVTRIPFSTSTGHDGTDHDGNENTHEDEEEPDVCQFGQGAVRKHDDEAGEPGDDEVDDEDMPAFEGVAGVEETVH